MKPKLILASLSPRRYDLLKKANLEFEVISENIDEIMNTSLSFEDMLQDLAYQKANAVFKKYPENIVIGADTIVYLNHEILGKPKDRQDASRMLHALSGNIHQVYTAVAILSNNAKRTFVEKTDVYFKELTESQILDYLEDGEWEGKAGAYAIQGKANIFVDHIEGDLDNVIGLPMTSLLKHLKDLFN